MTQKIFIAAFVPALFFIAAALRATEVSTAATAGIEAAAKASDSAPAALELPPEQAATIRSATQHLSALISKWALLDPKELEVVLTEAAALDVRITDLLGPVVMSDLEEKRKEQLAQTELQGIRSLLIAYYGDNEGAYPKTPEELIPKYLAAIPELELPYHTRTEAIELNADAGADMAKAVTDSGGWLYFANPASANFGMLTLNCSHKDRKGDEFYRR